MSEKLIIDKLLHEFSDIRYIAIYKNEKLFSNQRLNTSNSSSSETDKYEELLVNPTLLKLATQRGNIDCGGLNYLIIGYGNFYQLVKSIKNGHISICVNKSSDLNTLPKKVFSYYDMLV